MIKFDRHIIIGICFMLGFCVIAPIMDAGLKELSNSLIIWQVAWVRFITHLIIILPIAALKYGRDIIRPVSLKFQLLRSFLLMLATLTYIQAITTIEIPDAVAIVFIAPILATAFSGLLLKEKVGIRRWSAVMVGFLGILVVLRPGFDAFAEGMLFALLCGVAYAAIILTTRGMHEHDHDIVTATYTPIVGFFVVGGILLFHDGVTMPQGSDWFFVLLVGICGALSQFCFIRSFTYGNASFISPFMYFEIIGAVAVGFFWFDYFPDLYTWIGITIIIGAGIYIAWRETILANQHINQQRDTI